MLTSFTAMGAKSSLTQRMIDTVPSTIVGHVERGSVMLAHPSRNWCLSEVGITLCGCANHVPRYYGRETSPMTYFCMIVIIEDSCNSTGGIDVD